MRIHINRWNVCATFCVSVVAGILTGCSTPQARQEEVAGELGRGVVAIRENPSEVVVSWRYLSSDPMNTSFNVYRNGVKIAEVPSTTGTFYKDACQDNGPVAYMVKPVVDGVETGHVDGSYTLPADAPLGYINIPLDVPAGGVTPSGEEYTYSPNDASVGDVDGDGVFEIILKWDPSNAHDNAHDGYTGNVYFDCYRLTGEKLWRIDMGHNVRAGAHYTQFMVYDLDGDGKAELVMKTSDGTVDGIGNVIGDATADYRESGDKNMPSGGDFPKGDPRGKPRPEGAPRDLPPGGDRPKGDPRGEPRPEGAPRDLPPGGERPKGDPRGPRPMNAPRNQGRILTGNEYLTVFNGLTGVAMKTIDYVPPRGNLEDWGDNRANRSDRFLACVAYLDGVHPSVVMCRGYYTRAVLAAFDWDGKELSQRWVFDSNNPGCEDYAGQGNHNLRVGDVDGDGCDEIIYGSCAIDHDGTGLYSTLMGHGDAMHLTRFAPDMKGLQVWDCHENRKDGSSFRDAATGEVLFQVKDSTDVGRCMAADIDPRNYGVEMWSTRSEGIRNVKGEVVNPETKGLSVNMAVWWDGDLLRELLDRNRIDKYDWEEGISKPFVIFEGTMWNNGTKANPCLQGDIIGDWREEVLFRTEDNTALRLYVSPVQTDYRFHTFLEDRVYRISIATQNVAYNQPTQPGFYFGPDLEGTFRGYEFKK